MNFTNNIQQQPNTTRVATITTGQNSVAGIRINIGYFKTVPGILKLLQLFFGILCIVLSSLDFSPNIHFLWSVAVLSFFVTLLWILAYFFSIREILLLRINWIFTEFIFTFVITILYKLAFIVQLSNGLLYYPSEENIAAGIFGIINTMAYLAGCYFLLKEHRAGNTL